MSAYSISTSEINYILEQLGIESNNPAKPWKNWTFSFKMAKL